MVDEHEQSGSPYDMITERDQMQEIGLVLDFQRGTMTWDGAETPMQQPQWLDPINVDQFEQEMFLMHDPVTTDAERIQRILDVKHAPVNLNEEVNKNTHLSKEHKQELKKLLAKFEDIFDGSLGTW